MYRAMVEERSIESETNNVHRPYARNAPQRDESNFNPNQSLPHSLMNLQCMHTCSSGLSLSPCVL